MVSRSSSRLLIPTCLVALLSLGCDSASESDTKQADAAAETSPAKQPERRPSLVEVAAGGTAPQTEIIVELVGTEARLVTTSSVGPAIDFSKRASDNEHLRRELLRAAKDQFGAKLRAAERPEIRVRLDVGATAAELVDLLFTMGQLGVVGYELEVTTPEGPRALIINMPETCFGQPTGKHCTTLHLRVTETGTLASVLLTDKITTCDVAPADSGALAEISGRAITPTGKECPGWPSFSPNDEGLAQLLAAHAALGTPCRGVEVSVDAAVPASSFLPTIAALSSASKAVIFKAGARGSCTETEAVGGPISIDSLPKSG